MHLFTDRVGRIPVGLHFNILSQGLNIMRTTRLWSHGFLQRAYIKALAHENPVFPWEIYLSFLWLSFFIWKTGIIIPTLQCNRWGLRRRSNVEHLAWGLVHSHDLGFHVFTMNSMNSKGLTAAPPCHASITSVFSKDTYLVMLIQFSFPPRKIFPERASLSSDYSVMPLLISSTVNPDFVLLFLKQFVLSVYHTKF